MLMQKRGWLPAQLDSLTMDELCQQIAALQYEIVLDSARAIYHMPVADKAAKGKRKAALHKLRSSPQILDRYAAWFVARWDAAKD